MFRLISCTLTFGHLISDFGPYFTERYRTPWAPALNFDGPHSDEVRRFFVENALSWITDFHIDALRLDALHAILDLSAVHFLEELAAAVREQVEILRDEPVLLDVPVHGLIYEVETGRLRTVL